MHRKMIFRVLGGALLFGCLLSATAVTGVCQAAPTETAPGAKAVTAEYGRIHIYRARRYMGSALAPSIYVNEKQTVRIGNGRRATLRLAPGEYQIGSDDKSSLITLKLEAGKEYFIRVDVETGAWKGHGKLTLIMPEQGVGEYKLQKPVEEDRKFDRDVIEPETEAGQ